MIPNKCATCDKELIAGAMPEWLIRIGCFERPHVGEGQYTVDVRPPFEDILEFCDLECLKEAVNHER